MYVEPVAGRQEHGSPTEKYVRKKAERLVEMGLLESKTAYRRLVFLMPLAHVPKDRSKLMGQTWGRPLEGLMGQTESLDAHGVDGGNGADDNVLENDLMGHTSGIRVNNLSVVNNIPPPHSEPVDNSDADTLAMASVFVEFIRKQEKARQCLCRVRESDSEVLAWVRAGLTLETLRKAYGAASWEREKKSDPSPINTGLLDAIVRRMLNGRGVSRKSEGETPTDVRKVVWYATPEGVEAKATEWGVPLEPRETLMARCFEVESARKQVRK